MNFEKQDQDGAQQAFLTNADEDDSFSETSQQETKTTWRRYWRLALESLMALLIVAMLARDYINIKVTRPSAVPQCMFISLCPKLLRKRKMLTTMEVPMKTYKFIENPRYLHEDMFASETETLHTLH